MRGRELGAWAGLAFGVYGTGWFLLQGEGPRPEQFEPAYAHVRAHAGPDDVVFLWPPYATRAREGLGDMDVRAVARPWTEDLEILDRVWLFALYGEGEGVVSRLQQAGLEVEGVERFDGGISVVRLRVPKPAPVAYDFVDRLKDAQVEHRLSGTQTEACDARRARSQQGGSGTRWVCPRNSEWLYVAPEWHRMGEHLRRCLWAHPPDAGELWIRFGGVPLDGGVLVGRAGHTLFSSTHAQASVRLTVQVEVDGLQRAQTFEFGLEDTWRPFRLKLPSVGTGTISFAVASDHSGANHFCFEADVRGTGS